MKIVHIITRLIIGGAQENTILSCEGLHQRGHDVYLLTGPTTGPEGSLVARAKSGGYCYEELPHMQREISLITDGLALRELQKRIREIQPDVVHTHSSKAGVIGRLAAHRAGVPFIVHTVHGMSFNRTQPALTRQLHASIERYCAKRCHAIVSVADAMTRQSLAAGIGRRDQYTTIRSGMVVDDFDPGRHDKTEVRRELQIPQDAIVVGTIARLFRNKGYEQLIPIMRRALHKDPRLHFLWIGDGAQRSEYESELTKLGIRQHVTLAGLVPPVQIPRLLSCIDLLAHTSQWEGLPRACVQALLMEKPVVSFDIDGAPEVVIPGSTGTLVALNDQAAFAGAIVELAGHPDLRTAYGRKGREICLSEFDHREMVRRLEALYATRALARS